MKTVNWIAGLAAAGLLGVLTSRAEALVCYSPAPGYFSDIVVVSGNQNLEVTCSSRPTGGALTQLSGRASKIGNKISANLLSGTGYTRAGAYGTNRQGIGCFAIDTNPTSASNALMDCGQAIGFVDVETGN